MPLTEFVEERLDLGILYGTEGGPEFRTTVVQAYSGLEERNVEWSYEGGIWSLGAHAVSRSTLDYVQSFFRARRGMAVGFRWKNYADYVIPKTVIGTGDGVEQIFQIVQVSDTGYGESYSRPLTKIVGGTPTVYLDDIPQGAGWSIDMDTGLLTFSSAPGIDVEVAVQCEFDTPVRFDTDSLRGVFKAYRTSDGALVYDINAIPIVLDKFS